MPPGEATVWYFLGSWRRWDVMTFSLFFDRDQLIFPACYLASLKLVIELLTASFDWLASFLKEEPADTTPELPIESLLSWDQCWRDHLFRLEAVFVLVIALVRK